MHTEEKSVSVLGFRYIGYHGYVNSKLQYAPLGSE